MFRVVNEILVTANDIAQYFRQQSLSLAVAESLTGGMLASQLAAAPEASHWFSGGIVAYTKAAKQRILAVGDSPVVSEETAVQMVRGVAALFGSDASVAVTGAAGPDGQEDAEVGEVWIAVKVGNDERAEKRMFNGDPSAICQLTCEAAVELLATVCIGHFGN
jgi:nicotinamide-nucleotide amidase